MVILDGVHKFALMLVDLDCRIMLTNQCVAYSYLQDRPLPKRGHTQMVLLSAPFSQYKVQVKARVMAGYG